MTRCNLRCKVGCKLQRKMQLASERDDELLWLGSQRTSDGRRLNRPAGARPKALTTQRRSDLPDAQARYAKLMHSAQQGALC
jgi:hypothetical protein